MADNVAITAGSGTTIAADDISGVLVQRVKVTWGPDGTMNDADVASGKPVPMQVRSATGLIPIGEPTDAKSTATDTTSVSLISISKQISASVQSSAKSSAATVTRPANTTAYTANDVVGGAITFANAAAAAGEIIVTSAELEIDVTAVPSGMTSFALYLYSVTPPSAVSDNGAFDIPSGDRASFIGKISLGTPVDEGSTLYIRTDAINAQVTAAGTSIYGYLVTAAGYTPASNSEVYKITLHTTGL